MERFLADSMPSGPLFWPLDVVTMPFDAPGVADSKVLWWRWEICGDKRARAIVDKNLRTSMWKYSTFEVPCDLGKRY